MNNQQPKQEPDMRRSCADKVCGHMWISHNRTGCLVLACKCGRFTEKEKVNVASQS